MTDKFTPEFIAEQRALASNANDRPWSCEWNWSNDDSDEDGNKIYCAWAESPVSVGANLSSVEPRANADREYMQAAVNNYPLALDEIERLEAENKRLREVFEKIKAERNLSAWTANQFREMAAEALKGGE